MLTRYYVRPEYLSITGILIDDVPQEVEVVKADEAAALEQANEKLSRDVRVTHGIYKELECKNDKLEQERDQLRARLADVVAALKDARLLIGMMVRLPVDSARIKQWDSHTEALLAVSMERHSP